MKDNRKDAKARSLTWRPVFGGPLRIGRITKASPGSVTHSLVGLAVLWLLTGVLARTLEAAGPVREHLAWLWLGWASHILVDMFNKNGVQLFWPHPLACVFLGNASYRIAAYGRADKGFMLVCLVLNVAAYPLARDGFRLSLHRALGGGATRSTRTCELASVVPLWPRSRCSHRYARAQKSSSSAMASR